MLLANRLCSAERVVLMGFCAGPKVSMVGSGKVVVVSLIA